MGNQISCSVLQGDGGPAGHDEKRSPVSPLLSLALPGAGDANVNRTSGPSWTARGFSGHGSLSGVKFGKGKPWTVKPSSHIVTTEKGRGCPRSNGESVPQLGPELKLIPTPQPSCPSLLSFLPLLSHLFSFFPNFTLCLLKAPKGNLTHPLPGFCSKEGEKKRMVRTFLRGRREEPRCQVGVCQGEHRDLPGPRVKDAGLIPQVLQGQKCGGGYVLGLPVSPGDSNQNSTLIPSAACCGDG